MLCVDQSKDAAEATRAMIAGEGGEAAVFAADVTRSGDCRGMVEEAVRRWGRLDILDNNVGIGGRATVVEGTSHRFRMVVAEECAFDRHESAHAMNLFDMHQKYADVMHLDEVLEHLAGLAGARTAA